MAKQMITPDPTRCHALVSKPFAPYSKQKQCPNPPTGEAGFGFKGKLCAEHLAHWIESNQRVA